jgi:ribonucleoside-diphosphate reductase alpha chain
VADDLEGIYQAVKENALLQKYAGGLGNDWTPVRALGSRIKGTNGQSQGVIPFLKVVNDTAVAVNQGGKRKGAVCAYLETWHLDIEEFLDLRKNTGDERRRTHDMNTANWIPDLFMKRVMDNAEWTLFSPVDVPTCTTFGADFEGLLRLRGQGRRRRDALFKRIPPCSCGARCSPCCSRPATRGSPSRTPATCARPSSTWAWCIAPTCAPRSPSTPRTRNRRVQPGLGQPARPPQGRRLDQDKLRAPCRPPCACSTTCRHQLLRHPQGTRANLRHRPVGLGIMGFADCLYALACPTPREAVEFADQHGSRCYHAYWASTELARERGRYSSFEGSLWDRGILPLLGLLEAGRGELEVNRDARLDPPCASASPATACATPTAWPSPPPPPSPTSSACRPASSRYQNLYVKSNLSGEFTVVNEALVRDLKALDLWDEVMVADLKYFDGSLARIDRVPTHSRPATPPPSRSTRCG